METTEKLKAQILVKENTWLTRGGYMDFGWGNGYVCLPEGHPCFGMDYDAIHDAYEINVNGGLTFSAHSKECTKWNEVPEGNWWIVGFDTAHSWDSLAMWPNKESVEREANQLLNQLENLVPISKEE